MTASNVNDSSKPIQNPDQVEVKKYFDSKSKAKGKNKPFYGRLVVVEKSGAQKLKFVEKVGWFDRLLGSFGIGGASLVTVANYLKPKFLKREIFVGPRALELTEKMGDRCARRLPQGNLGALGKAFQPPEMLTQADWEQLEKAAIDSLRGKMKQIAPELVAKHTKTLEE